MKLLIAYFFIIFIFLGGKYKMFSTFISSNIIKQNAFNEIQQHIKFNNLLDAQNLILGAINLDKDCFDIDSKNDDSIETYSIDKDNFYKKKIYNTFSTLYNIVFVKNLNSCKSQSIKFSPLYIFQNVFRL